MAATLIKAGVIYDERGPLAAPGDLAKTSCTLATATFAVIVGVLTDTYSGDQHAWVINPTTGTVGSPIVLPTRVLQPTRKYKSYGVALDDDTVLLVLNNSTASSMTGDTFVCTITSAGVITTLANPTWAGLMRGMVYRPVSEDFLVRFLTSATDTAFKTFALIDNTSTSVSSTPESGESLATLDSETIYARTAVDSGILDRYTGAVRVALDMTSTDFNTENAAVSASSFRYHSGPPGERQPHVARIEGDTVHYDLLYDSYGFGTTSDGSPEDADHAYSDVRAFEELAIASGGIWDKANFAATQYELYLQTQTPTGVTEELRHSWPLPVGFVADGGDRGVDFFGCVTSMRNGLVLALFEGALWGYDPVGAVDDYAAMLGFATWTLAEPVPRVRVSFQRGRG